MAEEKQSDKKSFVSTAGSAAQGFFLMFIAFVAMISFSNTGKEEVLIFALSLIALWIGLPRLLDFLKDRGEQKKTTTAPAEVTMLRERLENLETLMCRLDAEINTQIEQSLSGGRLMTVAGTSTGNSHMPTTFLNIASLLEGRYQVLR